MNELLKSIKILRIRTIFFFSLLIFSNFSNANCPDVVASFTTSTVNICGPGASVISFVNTSTGANSATADYTWALNGVTFDNTTGLVAPNTSTISAVGTYTFRLIASDPSVPCTDTSFVTVRIHNIPNANFTFNPNNACAGTTINFNNTSTGTSGATTYNWNFGDGQTSTNQNPNHVYAAGGTYNVTLTVTNFAGCTDVQTFAVTALDIPAVAISGDDGDGNTTNCLLPGDPTVAETVVFTNTTTGAVSYAWDFGDGNTSTAQNPSHTYNTYGTYTVTMTATHANGCTATATLTVVFEKYVSAALTLNITEYSGCAPHTLNTLSNLSVNGNSYTWNFGDGTPPVTTTSIVPPTHTYLTAGTYTITLTAANSCNSAQATISPIVIVGGPNANFTSSIAGFGNLGCAPQNINFTNLSNGASPANNYTWVMGNGNSYTTTTTPPVQTYATQGTYNVMLVAGSACGFDTIIQTYVIDSIPIAAIAVNPDTGCSPLTVNVTNNSSGNNVTYSWFIDGVLTYTTQNIPPQVFTAPPGNTAVTHTVSLTVSNHCGTRTDTETILVHPAVNAIFTMNTDSICAGQSITFSDGSFGDFLSWQWDFGNGSTSILQGPHTITYPVAGTYAVRLIVNGFCGVDTLIQTIVVNPIPVAVILPDVISGCAPLAVNFTNGSTIGGIYNWNFGVGAIPATSTNYTPPVVNYSVPGSSQVVLQVNVLGCLASDTVTITVFALPVPSFTINPATGCTPLDVAFTNTSAVTLGDTYNWDFGNLQTSTNQNPGNQIYIAAANDSSYTVTLTITTVNNCVATATNTILVHPLPIADFTALPDTVCANTAVAFLNNSTGASSFAWDFDDGFTSVAISPAHTFTAQGTYTVQLIATTVFGCRDTVLHNVVVDSIPTAAFNFSIECFSDTTSFIDLSTGGITDWSWNFGDGTPISNTQHPLHLYAAAGNYNVNLTVTNPAGCTHTLSQLVTVNPVPIANFNSANFCLGQSTQFTDLTSGVPIAWNWNFGDGTNAVVQHPSHTYLTAGTYTVTLISFGGAGCSDTVTLPITITGIPTSNFNAVSVCANDTTFFTDLSLGNPDVYTWNFGDGITDNTNNPNPEHVYNSAGTYNVTLTSGYAASGCTNSITIPVVAFPRTNPNFSTNTPCLGAVTNFTDLTSGTPINWEWNFGDGSPIDNTASPNHTYANNGTFTITLITSNAFSCVDTLIGTVQVNPLPIANFTNTVICDGVSTSFTDLSTSAVQWSWNFGDGSPNSNSQSPFHLFPSNGTYQVQLVVHNVFGCSDTLIQSVTVNPNPIADFNFNIACFSYPTNFIDNSTGAIQWNWDFDDAGAVSIAQNNNYVFTSDGLYDVELIVTNVFGCRDTSLQTVTVLPQPLSGFTNTTVCAGQTVQFTDTSFGFPNTWFWDFADGSPIDNSQNPIHTFAIGGTYIISLISGNSSGCFDTTLVPVTVFTVPTPDFSADTVCLFNITHFIDLSTDAVALQNWYWDFDDGNNSFSQNPTYIFQNPGVYNVSLTITNINGCDSSVIIPVLVNDIPVAAFTADTVCLGAPTTFTDVSTGNPSSWTWSFGDGTVVNGNAVEQYTYANAGSYIVTLLVGGIGNNCSDLTFGVVTVSTDAIAGVNLPDTVCVSEVFTFNDNSTINTGTIVSQTWDMGDGTIYNTANGTHLYAVSGTYFVTHSVTSSGGCSSQIVDTIIVNPLPIANFAGTNTCSGLPAQFTDLSTATIISWNWNFGDGVTDTLQNPIHVYSASGIYNSELIVTNNFGCSDTLIIPVEVYATPTASFTNNTTCWGTPVSFFDNSTVAVGDTIVSWFWDFGDGNTSFLEEDQNSYQVYNDTFFVTHVVTTANGCTDSVTQIVTTLPIVNFDFAPDVTNGCAPLTVNFSDLSTTTGAATIVGWVWNFGDGIFSFAQNPNHIYANDGTYFVSLQVTTSDGCTFSDTLNYPITVFPQPVADFTATPFTTSILTPEITFTDLSNGAISWEYYFGDNLYSNLPSGTHIYSEPGEYTIVQMVTNQFGCRDTTERLVIILEETTFYAPNAFTPDDGNGKNDLFFVTGTNIVNVHLFVFNRWGEKIFETQNINEGWDGRYKGEYVQQDVYVWKAKLEYANGDAESVYGHVTVLRKN